MFRKMRQAHPQQVPEDDHVDRKSTEVIREVGLGKHAFDQVDHDLQAVRFVLVHDLEDEGGEHVEPLTVPDLFIPPCVRQKDPLEQRLVFLPGRAAEKAAASPVQVLERGRVRKERCEPWHCRTLTICIPSSLSSGFVHSLKQTFSSFAQLTPRAWRCFSARAIHSFRRKSAGIPPGSRATIFIASRHWLNPVSPPDRGGDGENLMFVSSPGRNLIGARVIKVSACSYAKVAAIKLGGDYK